MLENKQWAEFTNSW